MLPCFCELLEAEENLPDAKRFGKKTNKPLRVVPLIAFALLSLTATEDHILNLSTMLALTLLTLLSANPNSPCHRRTFSPDPRRCHDQLNQQRAWSVFAPSLLLCILDHSNLAVNNWLRRLHYLFAVEIPFLYVAARLDPYRSASSIPSPPVFPIFCSRPSREVDSFPDEIPV